MRNFMSVGKTPVLSLDAIRARAPSVFAAEPHSSRSERYSYIPTVNVIEGLLAQGFVCLGATQARARTEDKLNYTKHMLKFVRASDAERQATVGEHVAMMTLKNSHDGSSAYELIEARFRWVCANGLMVSEKQSQSIRVPHKGDVVGRVIEGTFEIIDNAKKTEAVIDDWQHIALIPDEQRLFADAALKLRWDGDEHVAPITPAHLLQAHRTEDQRPDLWTTFNRVQENLVNGGMRTRNAQGRRQTVRGVNGIDGNIALNRALWALTEGFAALKKAA